MLEIFIKDMKHFDNVDDILEYITKHTEWIAGFASGEGSFSAYAYVDAANTWGIQFGIDFSISQLVGDRILLEAINAYFKNEGGVYDRTCGVSVVTFRNLQTLKHLIIPFFILNPLVGTKSYEFERWAKLVEIFYVKEHIGKSLKQRDVFLKFLSIAKELNGKRVNKRKNLKIDIMAQWLKDLNGVPTKEEKLALKQAIKTNLIALTGSNDEADPMN